MGVKDLMSRWDSMVYAFHKPIPEIREEGKKWAHVFTCAAQGCGEKVKWWRMWHQCRVFGTMLSWVGGKRLWRPHMALPVLTKHVTRSCSPSWKLAPSQLTSPARKSKPPTCTANIWGLKWGQRLSNGYMKVYTPSRLSRIVVSSSCWKWGGLGTMSHLQQPSSGTWRWSLHILGVALQSPCR